MDDVLKLLASDAGLSKADLGRALGIPVEEVESRIAALERDGAILGYQAILDPQKVGETAVTAAVEVRITPERGGGFDRLAQRIARFAEVKSCYLMSGGYDLLVMVEAPTLQAVATFISEKLATIKGVIGTATRFRLKPYKENGVPMFREERASRLAVAP